MLRIATWNVNSLRVRQGQLADWVAKQSPDVLALQETKLPDADFPVEEIAKLGYQALANGQRTYNGVAILHRAEAGDVVRDLPALEDPQRRVLAATIAGVRVIDVYVPNGQSVDSDKYAYKLDWMERLAGFVAGELARHPRLVLLGDMNVAPEDRDVHDPEAWRGKVLFSDPERAAFRRLLGLGLTDAFRLFEQPERSFTWWDYRMLAFRRKQGLRIDHILVSAELAKRCVACRIDVEPRRLERPSDHAPVIADLDL
jgi:exodeoxyribonuclease-3